MPDPTRAMLSRYDLLAIGCYLVFLCAIDWGFRRFASNVKDYFAGGHRMVWWLLGADSFLSNFGTRMFPVGRIWLSLTAR